MIKTFKVRGFNCDYNLDMEISGNSLSEDHIILEGMSKGVHKYMQIHLECDNLVLPIPLMLLKNIHPVNTGHDIYTNTSPQLARFATTLVNSIMIDMEFYDRTQDYEWIEKSYKLVMDDEDISYEIVNGAFVKSMIGNTPYSSFMTRDIADYIQDIRVTDFLDSRMWIMDYNYAVVALTDEYNTSFKDFLKHIYGRNVMYPDDFHVLNNRLYLKHYDVETEIPQEHKKLVALAYVLFASIVGRTPCILYNVDVALDPKELIDIMDEYDTQVIFSTRILVDSIKNTITCEYDSTSNKHIFKVKL